MKRLVLMLLAISFLLPCAVSVAETSPAGVVPVKHKAQKHKAHKATKHKAPKGGHKTV